MSAPPVAGTGKPMLRIRGRSYPVLLPSIRDPRLHLAAVIISLQILGQVAFDFRLSIAQILISVITCAVLEVAIAFRQQHVILWPASALLTGNGVAFILRVPGTEHGDWWSLRGWWIFAGTAAVALLSKYIVKWKGRHIFNPSNFGLVAAFLILGSAYAEPLDFWWGPMSLWLALAIAIIVTGGFAILSRLHLVGLAAGFWIAFAAGIGVLAASGHAMTARWHLGPIADAAFWRALVFSPEILVFLFFMITDPKTVPTGRVGRRVFGVSVGLLSVLLIAPQGTEFASKVAVLGALAIVCAVRPVIDALGLPARMSSFGSVRRPAAGAIALAGVAAFMGLVVLAGIPAREAVGAANAQALDAGTLPEVTVVAAEGVSTQIDERTAQQIAHDVVAGLRTAADALQQRDAEQAADAADGAWLASLRQQIRRAGGGAIAVPAYTVEKLRVTLERGIGQGPPNVIATAEGTVEVATYASSSSEAQVGDPEPFTRTFELALAENGRFVIVGSRGSEAPQPPPATTPTTAGTTGFVSPNLTDVAGEAGLDFRHDAFAFKTTSTDPEAMMGGGVCWLDYDADGWMDLFVVNSYSELDVAQWKKQGGLPRSALFHNDHGKFADMSRGSGADLAVRGNGCVAADLDQDGYTDLVVTTTTYDALLWNNGDGTFTEGARDAGIDVYGWHTGAAVGDVNGDRRPDLFVAGYTDPNGPVPGSFEGFPTNHLGVRDLLYLNEGSGPNGRPRFREVGVQAGLESANFEHGLGAVLSDLDGDGRLDLYVANDEDPNRLYENVATETGLGFRFQDVAKSEGVDDANAGMGIAAADYAGDGRPDLLVTNSRGQGTAAYRSEDGSFVDARADFTDALRERLTGWGIAWADLDSDTDLDLVLSSGAIPVTNLAVDAEPMQVVENVAAPGAAPQFTDVAETRQRLRLNGRGVAAADFDNDGDVDFAVNSIAAPLVLLENTNPGGNWLEVSLAGFHPGARITAELPDGRKLVREVLAGSSYLSSEDPRVHFGLGGAKRVKELTVTYPDGSETRLTDVPAGRILSVGP